jgi:hypothetical protein
MTWITYGLIGAYALLTGVAGIVQWKDKGFQVRTLLFIISAISIVAALWIPNKTTMLMMLLLFFVLLHVLAIAEGLLTNGKIRYGHHLFRLVFHLTLFFLVFQFIF